MQNSSSKSLVNEFLKAFYIRLAVFLSISFKYLFIYILLRIVKEYSHNDPLKSGKSFGRMRKQVRETIKSKMALLKSATTCSFFFFFFFRLIQYGVFLQILLVILDKSFI
jgi:hypothetical protein